MPRKVAIVGTATTTCGDAPFGDDSWEIWGMAYDATLERMDTLFEIHPAWKTQGDYPNTAPGRDSPQMRIDYINFLEAPCYFMQPEPEVTLSRVYPLEDAARAIHCPLLPDGSGGYFESTIGYQLALLVLEKAQGRPLDRVGLWGVDLATGGEYAYQRPNAEYLIGLLRGMGVSVFVPKRSALLSSEFLNPPYRYT